jgi:heme o synthase
VVAPATALTLARGTRGRVAAYVALTKPRIVELLLVTTLPTMIVAQRGLPSIGLIVATLAGGSLAAGGANAINMFVDLDIDQLMHRTRNRPLVTGAVTPSAALVFACLLEVAAFGELWRFVNLLSAVLAVSATAFYVFVYTLWLKRRSAQNIVIGGAAGAVPPLVGYASASGHLGWAALAMFGIVFLWTPPHFWALAVRYRDDYEAASVPMLPVVAPARRTARDMFWYTALLIGASIAFAPIAHMGVFYLTVAAAAGALYAALVIRLWVHTGNERDLGAEAMRLFGYSITYLSVLFASMAIDVFVRRLH